MKVTDWKTKAETGANLLYSSFEGHCTVPNGPYICSSPNKLDAVQERSGPTLLSSDVAF